MDKVRLDVRETSRNSEKLNPKASKPPIHKLNNECRKGESSVCRNNLSEVLRLRPVNKTEVSLGHWDFKLKTPDLQNSLIVYTAYIE